MFPAPFAKFLEFNFPFNRFSVFAGGVISMLTGCTAQTD